MDKLKGVGARARALAEAARRNAELSEARNEMAQAFRALGEAHYAKDTLRAAELVNRIDGMKAQVESLLCELDALRAERRCPRCGAVQSRENRFCAQCGAALETHEGMIHWPETGLHREAETRSGKSEVGGVALEDEKPSQQ